MGPAPGYAQYPSGAYPYPMPPQSYYYPPVAGYPSAYPQQHPPTYQSSYSRPPYATPQSNMPQQYPPYPPQVYQSNGYHRSNAPTQQYANLAVPGHTNSPPTKRQKLEPRPSQSNGSHTYSHKHPRGSPKEKKQFSDFRVSKIKVGEFVSGMTILRRHVDVIEETRLDTDIRDSRLRFYFRSGPSSHPSPHQQSSTPVDIATQFPDRLSVSLQKGTRRIVLPAAHLSLVQFNRAEGYVKVEGDGWATVLPPLPKGNV